MLEPIGISGCPKPFARGCARRQRGATLVETLITLVSISVGLLGIAALHLVSLRSNQEADVRLQASSLASSMLERVRTNRAAFHAGAYDDIPFNGVESSSPAISRDLQAWQEEIDSRLPGAPDDAAGAIRRAPNSNVVTVTVQWREKANSDRLASLQIQTEL